MTQKECHPCHKSHAQKIYASSRFDAHWNFPTSPHRSILFHDRSSFGGIFARLEKRSNRYPSLRSKALLRCVPVYSRNSAEFLRMAVASINDMAFYGLQFSGIRALGSWSVIKFGSFLYRWHWNEIHFSRFSTSGSRRKIIKAVKTSQPPPLAPPDSIYHRPEQRQEKNTRLLCINIVISTIGTEDLGR